MSDTLGGSSAPSDETRRSAHSVHAQCQFALEEPRHFTRMHNSHAVTFSGVWFSGTFAVRV